METILNMLFAVGLIALILWGTLWVGSFIARSPASFYRLGLIALIGALLLLLPWRGGFGAASLAAMALLLHKFAKVKWFPGVAVTLLIAMAVLILYITAWAAILPGAEPAE